VIAWLCCVNYCDVVAYVGVVVVVALPLFVLTFLSVVVFPLLLLLMFVLSACRRLCYLCYSR